MSGRFEFVEEAFLAEIKQQPRRNVPKLQVTDDLEQVFGIEVSSQRL